ncbi:MAG TPA: hypothetical protein VHD15_12480 [Hyphomicrobiales bacterium]|nr:hypothetical protein [Hyphomicrobiales bacterium]
MTCDRCHGLGTIVIKPAVVHDDAGGDGRGAVIALCPACHGSGLRAAERRGPIRLKPAAATRAARAQ